MFLILDWLMTEFVPVAIKMFWCSHLRRAEFSGVTLRCRSTVLSFSLIDSRIIIFQQSFQTWLGKPASMNRLRVGGYLIFCHFVLNPNSVTKIFMVFLLEVQLGSLIVDAMSSNWVHLGECCGKACMVLFMGKRDRDREHDWLTSINY